MADDNDPEGNHKLMTNALFGDGAVRSFDVFEEREKGNADPEDEFLRVGPDARIEQLRVLTLD